MAEDLTESRLENSDFRQLVAGLGEDLAISSPRTLELVFDDDLPVRVVLHPDEQRILTEIYLYDAAILTGLVRSSVVDTCLLLNHAALCGEPYHIGLDSRDFLVLFCTRRLAELDAESFTDWLDYLVLQARRLRRLVRTIAFQEAELSFSLRPAAAGSAAGE